MALSFGCIHPLWSQCAKGSVTMTKFMATSGTGTYTDPAKGKIDFEVCFQLEEFFEAQTNWVHGIFISFSDLQDGVSYSAGSSGEQNTQYGVRKWIYIDSLKARQFNLPGPGYYVDDVDGNPRNNYGDNGKGTPKANFPDLLPFCIKASYECGYPRILRPIITVTGDGTSGGWNNPSCPGDKFVTKFGGPSNTGYVVVCGAVLPLELISFYGIYQNDGNYLSWSGRTDQLFSHYELERKAEGETQYKFLERFIPLIQNPETGLHDISYVDRELQDELHYYRLKLVEKDFSYSYSPVISIRQNQIPVRSYQMKIYPQPAVDYLVVDWFSHEEKILYKVYNLAGSVVISGSLNGSPKRYTQQTISISNLQTGTYFIKFTDTEMNSLFNEHSDFKFFVIEN